MDCRSGGRTGDRFRGDRRKKLTDLAEFYFYPAEWARGIEYCRAYCYEELPDTEGKLVKVPKCDKPEGVEKCLSISPGITEGNLAIWEVFLIAAGEVDGMSGAVISLPFCVTLLREYGFEGFEIIDAIRKLKILSHEVRRIRSEVSERSKMTDDLAKAAE